MTALLCSNQEGSIAFLDGVDQSLSFRDREGHRLFAVDMLSCFQCFERAGHMPVVRRGNKDRVDIVAAEQLSKVLCRFNSATEPRLGILGASKVDIADTDDLPTNVIPSRFIDQPCELHPTHAAPDDGDADCLLPSSVPTPTQACRADHGGGGFDELAACEKLRHDSGFLRPTSCGDQNR